MSFWTAENLSAVTGGSWLVPARAGADAVRGASIDTRTLRPGQVFVAIAGERTDGHRHLSHAAEAGAWAAVIDDPAAAGFRAAAGGTPAPRRDLGGMGVLRVGSTREALLALGAAYRRSLARTRVIAVGGSNGKTTTTRLVESVLSRGLRGTASAKSFNNSLGVPLTILGAHEEDDYLVCEVGTNAPGEIAQLAAVVGPDIAVVTSIGREHLEGFGSLEGVLREEAGLLRFVRPGGAAVVNADAEGLVERAREILGGPGVSGRRLVAFGGPAGADLRVGEVEHAGAGLRFAIAGRGTFELPLLGRHNAMNAAAAVAVGELMGLSRERIAAGLAGAKGAAMRLERVRIGEIHVLNDAYNANPDSMRAALGTLAELGRAAVRRVAVLGDMLELGRHTEASHREIGGVVRAAGVDLAVFVGPNMKAAAAETPGSVHFDALGADEMGDLVSRLRPGDLVLLKGSRRMGLERVAAALAERGTMGERTGAGAA